MDKWCLRMIVACWLAGPAAAGLAVAQAGVAVAQTATVRLDETLRAEPAPTAAEAGKIDANAKVRMVERKGFWAKVSAPGASGWLKLSSLSLETSGSGTGNAALPALTSLATGRTGSGNVVSAAGTRGLSAEDLRAAQPDMDAVARVKAMAVSADAANRYAQDGGLAPRQVGYVTASGAPKP